MIRPRRKVKKQVGRLYIISSPRPKSLIETPVIVLPLKFPKGLKIIRMRIEIRDIRKQISGKKSGLLVERKDIDRSRVVKILIRWIKRNALDRRGVRRSIPELNVNGPRRGRDQYRENQQT